MPHHAPWTEIGRIQSDIDELRQRLRTAASTYDVDSLKKGLQHVSNRLDEVEIKQRHLEDDLYQHKISDH